MILNETQKKKNKKSFHHRVSQLRFECWLAFKFFKSKKTFFDAGTLISLLGLSVGVAALFVSMAVFRGFEQSLKAAVSDVTGHVQIVRKSPEPLVGNEMEEIVRKTTPELVGAAKFLRTEALLVANKSVQGVLVQGVDSEQMNKVLKLSSRMISGSSRLQSGTLSPAEVIIGQGAAKKFHLRLDDIIKIVVPVSSELGSDRFHRQVMSLKIIGIADFGKNDWNERFFLTSLKTLQNLTEVGDRYHGLLLQYPDHEVTLKASFHLSQALSADFWITDWRSLNQNLFDAIELERYVIFLVVLIIVVVAALSISSSLFIHVLRRFPEISLMRSYGLTKKSVARVFAIQGLFLGLLGIFVGFSLGLLLSGLFVLIQKYFSVMQGSVYKLDTIGVALSWFDLCLIIIATLVITLLAALVPAIRGSKMPINQGIRYG